MKTETTLFNVLMKYIHEDTFVVIDIKHDSEHYHSIDECLSSNINRWNKKVKHHHYYIDGLLEIVL